MTRRSIVLRMRPLPWYFRAVYRHRGIPIPLASGRDDLAGLVPLRFRRWHQVYAAVAGYFWLPCPLCQREFGGHEITPTIPDPMKGEAWGMSICPFCAIERRRKGIPNGQ